MGLSVAKGVLTLPTTGGLPVALPVTGLGFQVKALLVAASYQTAAGQANGPGRFSLGMATQDGGVVQQGYTTIFNPDNVATSTMNVGCNTNALLKGLTSPSATTVGSEYIVTCVSLDSDGFTLNVTDLPASGIKVHYWALGGSDITAAKVVSSTLASNTTTNVTVGAGWGQPDLILAMGSTGGFGFADAAAAGNMFFGAALSSSVRQSATIWSEDAAPTENLVGSQRQKFIYTFRGSTAGGAAEANADLSAKGSWPTDGFQVSNSGATSGDSIIFMALKGSFQAAIGTVQSSNVLNATSDFNAGFPVAGTMYFGLNQPPNAADITADGVGTQWGAFGVGFFDGVNQGFAAYSSDLANTTISTGQSHSETRAWQAIDPATTGAPTLQGEGQASAPGNNARLTWTDPDVVATREIGVLALGSAPSAGAALSGSTSASAGSTGALTAAPVVSGSASAAAAATGSLQAPSVASGSSAAAASSSAALKAPSVLAGSAPAAAAGTGTLAARSVLAGASSASSSSSGTVATPPAAALSGSSAASSAASGSVIAPAVVAGVSSATAASTGAVTTPGAAQLSGSSVAAAASTGALRAASVLSGSTPAVSASTGSVGAAPALTGNSAAAAASTGSVQTPGTASLSGSSAAAGASAGALRALAILAGASPASSVSSGALGTPAALVGATGAGAAGSGDLRTTAALAGASVALAAAIAEARTPATLAGVSAALSAASGLLTTLAALEGVSVAVAQSTGTVRFGRGNLPITDMPTSLTLAAAATTLILDARAISLRLEGHDDEVRLERRTTEVTLDG